MPTGLKSVIYPVHDLAAAKAVFRAVLGVDPYMDEPYYVGFAVEGTAGTSDVGLDPHGHDKGMTGPVAYWHVDDLEKSIAELVEAGATPQQAPNDVGGGSRIATVTDTDGNVIGLMQEAH